jgi:hypothetical protein
VPPVGCSLRCNLRSVVVAPETITTSYIVCSMLIYQAAIRQHDECATRISCMYAGHCHHDIDMYASTTAALCFLAAVLHPTAAVAQTAQPVLTAADVRRIALASAPGAGSSSRFATAASGMQQAKALGIPINTMAISRDPTLAKVRRHSAVPSCLPSLPAMHVFVANPLSMCALAACMCSTLRWTPLCCQRVYMFN